MGSRVLEGERTFRMMDGLATPKMPQLMKMSRSCTPWLCGRRRDLRSIASDVGAVQSNRTDILGMSKVWARWVSRMLTNYQKRTRLNISRNFLSHYEDDPSGFIEQVVTQDGTWVHHFDPESKKQSYNGSTLAYPS